MMIGLKREKPKDGPLPSFEGSMRLNLTASRDSLSQQRVVDGCSQWDFERRPDLSRCLRLRARARSQSKSQMLTAARISAPPVRSAAAPPGLIEKEVVKRARFGRSREGLRRDRMLRARPNTQIWIG